MDSDSSWESSLSLSFSPFLSSTHSFPFHLNSPTTYTTEQGISGKLVINTLLIVRDTLEFSKRGKVLIFRTVKSEVAS